MNITEMVNSIIAETNLAVFRNQMQRRVMEAVKGIHNSAFFTKDLEEDFIVLTGNTHSNFSIPLPPRFRKFKAIKPMTALKVPVAITTNDNTYEPSEIRNAVNYYNEPKSDFYYVAGTVANISSSVAPPALYISWYASPEVEDPLLETWLMREHPQVIMDWALARFWKVNGKESVARDIERTLYSVDLQNIINNHATEEGL